MPTVPSENGIDYWQVKNSSGISLCEQLPPTPAPGGTYAFLYTGVVTWFRLATYQGGKLQLATCLQNDVDYIMVYDNQYFLNLTSTTGTSPSFTLAKLSSDVRLTYFRLRDPRNSQLNTFIINQPGNSVFYSVGLYFQNSSYQRISFTCPSCPCTVGFSCNQNGDCYNPACSGAVCGGNCPGVCSNGGECRQNSGGVWDCYLDCADKPCGGGCFGPCSNGLACIEVGDTGLFTCGDPCSTGVCGGKCNGPCPSGQACQKDSAGTYTCKTSCTGQCSGFCQGTCSEGKICKQGTDQQYSCQVNTPENTSSVSIWKQWWFWIALIGGIVLLLVLVYVAYRSFKKKPRL